MKGRFHLVSAGLFPETMPPCFDSSDSERAFRGLVGEIDKTLFHERRTNYVRYTGTKHDGSRRNYGIPNIATYLKISSFIWRNWGMFEKALEQSPYSIGTPKLLAPSAERALKIPSLSELSRKTSSKIGSAPFVLHADISQCFPSIYTHSIAWAAHGIAASKKDTNKNSKTNFFNELDFHVRSGQQGQTRGVLVGPDAYRLIAELILCKIDAELKSLSGDKIIGAARHVDDFYIGLRSEHDAESVLSNLRDVLADFELQLNDQKTEIFSSLEPINDLWAQRLRRIMRNLDQMHRFEDIESAVSEAVFLSKEQRSSSPLKILVRHFDDKKLHLSPHWEFIEQNLLRIAVRHPHVVDYICLFTAKRFACGAPINTAEWASAAEIVIRRGLNLNHHHEVLWMLWLLCICNIDIKPEIVEELSKNRNDSIRSFLIQAYVDQKILKKPSLGMGSKLPTTSEHWLSSLVAKSTGFTKAAFSGDYSGEFAHLSQKKISLVNFRRHVEKISKPYTKAISRARYGYDDQFDEDLPPWEIEFDPENATDF